jgi:hypothetical protein
MRAGILASHGKAFRVIATFRRCAYLDEGICIAEPSIPLGPLVSRMDKFPPLEQGERVMLDPGSIWVPPPCRINNSFLLREVIASALSAISWTQWVSEWPARQMAEGFLRDVWALPHSADSLVGVGPGLTPAGDDVLAGFALVRRAMGLDPPAVDLSRTTSISQAMLRCALDGEPSEDVAELLYRPCRSTAIFVAERGATSGPAMLLGMIAALRICRAYEIGVASLPFL